MADAPAGGVWKNAVRMDKERLGQSEILAFAGISILCADCADNAKLDDTLIRLGRIAGIAHRKGIEDERLRIRGFMRDLVPPPLPPLKPLSEMVF